jgi:hypothetical protein
MVALARNYAAGNMFTLTSGDTAVYDAWNRLVEVTTGSGENLTTVEKFGLKEKRG